MSFSGLLSIWHFVLYFKNSTFSLTHWLILSIIIFLKKKKKQRNSVVESGWFFKRFENILKILLLSVVICCYYVPSKEIIVGERGKYFSFEYLEFK